MAQRVCVVLSATEHEQLAAIVADRNRPRKHVERARTVLASAERHSAQRVAKTEACSSSADSEIQKLSSICCIQSFIVVASLHG